ncbi:efflux RND transporter periplasmic adaptor subunit, partial [Mesorhizobium sp. M2E.F.Ca.ET.154.01.1.1]
VHETLVARTPSGPAVTITLLSDPQIRAVGKVREISPAVDPASGSIRVKVGIPNTPAGMPLGAAVIGSASAKPVKAILLPWQALTSTAGKPAVWVVDPSSKAVSTAEVEVLAFDSGVVVVDKGLQEGQNVVTAGGQLLSPGQTIEVAGASQ